MDLSSYFEDNRLRSYFEYKRLVTILCRKRVNSARISRRSHFIASMSGQPHKRVITKKSKVDPKQQLSNILPPRRIWNRFRPDAAERRRPGSDAPAKLASAMARHVLRELDFQEPRYQWVSRLKDFLDTVRERAMSWRDDTVFNYQEIHAFPKGNPGSGQKYRIVASYTLEDSLICGGFSAYLRTIIEDSLSSSCLSFRGSPSGGRPPSHHDAVPKILKLSAGMSSEDPLWCAEADIQGFFDAVSHEIALRECTRLLSYCKTNVDSRLMPFLRSFLEGYNYEEVAVPKATALLDQKGIKNPKFADPAKALASLGISPSRPYGIPQGSAMSCVLANVVLSAADTVVESILQAYDKANEGLYIRYCDDIVILHKNQQVCKKASDAYVEELRRLCLPYHELKPVERYPGSRAEKDFFWDSKSKAPYPWGGAQTTNTVPWLAFVGYQFRRDGVVRVRKASMEKELRKQRQVATDIVNAIRKTSKKARVATIIHQIPTLRSIRYRAMMHMLSIGVGYPNAWQTLPAPGSVSWANGFPGVLKDAEHAVRFRTLDRGRVRVLRFLRGRVLGMITRKLVAERSPSPPTPSKKEFRLRFAGSPFSYAKQFFKPLSGPTPTGALVSATPPASGTPLPATTPASGTLKATV